MGTQLLADLDFRPASRVQATLELQPGAGERLLILTQLERPIFEFQNPDGTVEFEQLENSSVIVGNGATGNAVLSISGNLPADKSEFAVVQMVSENGHGLLEALNIRGAFGVGEGGSSVVPTIAIVEGVLLALMAGAFLFTLQSKRRSPAARF
jgi:hypothetical protein